ncbi:MAG: nucleotidyltransferase [Hyphomonadaceae bacterium]|nr:nucleotidyltransferase [Hyphomonadaceae bacterium]
MPDGFSLGGRRTLTLADELLIDIAIKIQLPPGLYALALDRYQTISDWMERPGSPLRGLIDQIHAQGSVLIGTTIRCRDDEDLFDLDMVTELLVSEWIEPEAALDLVEEALAGAKGSRYWSKTDRQTRCVTVEYAEMHIDVTPIVRLANTPDRVGHIFHAKKGTPASQHRRIEANPWGFGRWYAAQTPADDWFGDLLLERSLSANGRIAKSADVEPPPGQEELYRKARATVALQLIKRHVQMLYDRRPNIRRPPSVALSCSVGWNAGGERTLLDEVIHQAAAFRAKLINANAIAECVEIRNPEWEPDLFTDRWPENLDAQRLFINDLNRFIAALEKARSATSDELERIFATLFGERVTTDVLSEKAAREGTRFSAPGPSVQPRSGRVVASTSTLGGGSVVRPRKQTFFGSDD